MQKQLRLRLSTQTEPECETETRRAGRLLYIVICTFAALSATELLGMAKCVVARLRRAKLINAPCAVHCALGGP